jgi:pimeloyl-ACP methyl ester carboxylesterase
VGRVGDPVGDPTVRIRAGELTIGYDVRGDRGDWVLFVTGLGYGRWSWDWQVEDFARHFRVITFDNRGVGESDTPPGPYTAAQMAEDTAGLLDALEVDRAHVIGSSLGGCIAIELALARPELVNRLVLCSTHAGGAKALPPPEGLLHLLAEAPALPEEVRLRRFVENALSDAFVQERPDVIDRILELRGETAQPEQAWQWQAAAGATFDAADRVERIEAETLVITGDEDRVVAPASSKVLADAIPNSTLVELPGGHLFPVERPTSFNQLVGAFLHGGIPALSPLRDLYQEGAAR